MTDKDELQEKDIYYLNEKLDRVEKEMVEGIRSVRGDIRALADKDFATRTYVDTKVSESEKRLNKEMEEMKHERNKQIAELKQTKASKWAEDALRWATYLVVGAVVMALLALVITSTS